MADEQLIKPRELPAATTVFADDAIMTDNGSIVGKATPVQIINAGAPVPTEAEAIAGTDNSKRMTPLTVKQVLDSVTAPSVLRAQAWAESDSPPDPGIPGSQSAKSWAEDAKSTAEIMEKASQQDQYSLTISAGQTVIDADADGNPIIVTGVADVYIDGFLLSPGVDYDVNGSGHPVLLKEWDAGKVVRVNLIPNYSSPTSKSTATPPSASLRAFVAEPYDSVLVVLNSNQITDALIGQTIYTKDGAVINIVEPGDGHYNHPISGVGLRVEEGVSGRVSIAASPVSDDYSSYLNYALSDGQSVIVPAGTWRIKSRVTIPEGRSLEGVSKVQSVLLKDGSFDGIRVQPNAIVSGLRVQGAEGNSGDGVYVAGGRTCIQSVDAIGHGGDGVRVGLKASDTGNVNAWRLIDIGARLNGGDGVKVADERTTTGPDVNAGVAMGLDLYTNGRHGLYLENAVDNDFSGICSQVNGGWGIYLGDRASGNTLIAPYTEVNVAGDGFVHINAKRNYITGVRSGVNSLTWTVEGTENLIIDRAGGTTLVPRHSQPEAFENLQVMRSGTSGQAQFTLDTGGNLNLNLTGSGATNRLFRVLGYAGLSFGSESGDRALREIKGSAATLNFGSVAVGASASVDYVNAVFGDLDYDYAIFAYPASDLPNGVTVTASLIDSTKAIRITVHNGSASALAWSSIPFRIKAIKIS